RARRAAGRPPADPRLVWRDGVISLLPLPDGSQTAVAAVETLGALVQEGDRRTLLREAGRILAPGGRLLLAEMVRTKTSLKLLGPAGLGLKPAEHWLALVEACGFELGDRLILEDSLLVLRANAADPNLARQLSLNL
ncbi:MAG: class I SAM-dependent methyltransferase, partial [Candidatus Promineifilaceae bacterium]